MKKLILPISGGRSLEFDAVAVEGTASDVRSSMPIILFSTIAVKEQIVA